MSQNDKTIEEYIEDYARYNTNGDIEAAKQHQMVKNVMELYEETKKNGDDKQVKTRKPVNMQGKCDA